MKKRTTIIPALCILMILICFAGAQTVGSSDTGVQMVILDKTSAAMYSGSSQKLQLNALALPETADFPGIRWSIRREPLCFAADDRIGTLSTYSKDDPGTKVNQTGMVTAGRASETAVVTVQTLDGELSASCTVRFYNAAQINERLNMLGYLNPSDGGRLPSVGETEPFEYSLQKFQARMGLTETGEPDIPTLTALFSETALESNEPVTGVAITPSYVEILADGELYTDLIAEILPKDAADKSITWTSSNADSLYIYNPSGWIRGYAPGTFTITATSANEITATCTVKVKPVPVSSITLSPAAISLVPGMTGQTRETVKPDNATNKAVTWTSSKPAVATVNSTGKVTGVSVGTAVITATAQDGSGVKGTCTVTVGKKITAVSLPATGRVAESQQLRLTPTITPSDAMFKTLNWTSNDASIATVNGSGLVTGVKSGTVYIYATAQDGSGAFAKCAVTVYYTPVTSFTVARKDTHDPQALRVFVGGTQDNPVRATIIPDNASYKAVKWYSSKPGVATINVTSGVLTGVSAGTTEIWGEVTQGIHGTLSSTKCTVKSYNKAGFTGGVKSVATAADINDQKSASIDYHTSEKERFVKLAVSQNGYQNGISDGSNIYFYLNETGGWSKYGHFQAPSSYAPQGEYHWCAAFVNWCARKAGVPTSKIQAGAAASLNMNNSNSPFVPAQDYETGDYHVPKVGDLVYFGKNGSVSHIGIVRGYNSVTNEVWTVEGNTSDANSKYGVVAKRVRRVNDDKLPVIGYSCVF